MALQSEWGELNPNLLVSITGGGDTVKAPIKEGTLEHTANWQSPFEASGMDSKAPMLMAMVQSGQITPIINALHELGGSGGGLASLASSLLDGSGLAPLASSLEGRTGITKLNSTQIFSGMPPIKISMTLLFRAYRSASEEVEAPFNKLFSWSLPKELAKDGLIPNINTAYARGGSGSDYLKALLPSEVPTIVSATIKGNTFKEMVIESISKPLDAPIDLNGNSTVLEVPIVLSTLTALDQRDWKAVASG